MFYSPQISRHFIYVPMVLRITQFEATSHHTQRKASLGWFTYYENHALLAFQLSTNVCQIYMYIYIIYIYIYCMYIYICIYIYIIKTNYPKHQEHSKNHRIFRGIFPPIWEQPPLLHITFGGCSQGIPSGHVTRDPRSTRLPGTLKRTANVAPENRPAETQ